MGLFRRKEDPEKKRNEHLENRFARQDAALKSYQSMRKKQETADYYAREPDELSVREGFSENTWKSPDRDASEGAVSEMMRNEMPDMEMAVSQADERNYYSGKDPEEEKEDKEQESLGSARKQRTKKTGYEQSYTLEDLINREEAERKDPLNQENQKKNEEEVVLRVREQIKNRMGDRIQEELKKKEKDPQFLDEVHREIETLLMNEGKYVRTPQKRQEMTERIYHLIVGYGPLEVLFARGYSEIMVSRYDRIFVEENGGMKDSGVKFASEAELRTVIEQMVSRIDRSINDANPLADGFLADGSRFNAVLPPIALDGAELTIRRFPDKKLTAEDYLRFGSLDFQVLWFLKKAVESKYNLVVSGGTGSGKTSLLNLMSSFLSYDPYLSVVTIEDSAELKVDHPNVRRLLSRPANASGNGEVTARDLVKNCMRMRPDVVVIGEIRDGVMADFLRLNTSGHEGGMTTVHNNSPEELDGTIQVLFKMAKDYEFSENTISRLYANAVDLIIQIKRYPDHKRRISHISHVVGYGSAGASALKIRFNCPEYNPSKVYIRDIFRWEKTGEEKDGTFTGEFRATGYVPKGLLEKSEMNGVHIDERIFGGGYRMEEGFLEPQKITVPETDGMKDTDISSDSSGQICEERPAISGSGETGQREAISEQARGNGPKRAYRNGGGYRKKNEAVQEKEVVE